MLLIDDGQSPRLGTCGADLRRQAVDLGLVEQQVERVQAAEDLVVVPVEPGVAIAPGRGAARRRRLGPRPQLLDRPELDRRRRAGLGTGGDEVVLEPVVAEACISGRCASGR